MMKFFLAVATFACLSTVVCGLGWYLATRPRAITMNDLGLEERQKLVEGFFDVSTTARTPAWFEPSVAFTLRRNTKISAWGDTFISNDLGYRTGPSKKDPRVFRVVFVGDSWAYGMGLSEEQSFPKQFEALANEISGSETTIETWTLALPGYNSINEVSALEVFFDRIRPDAVVLCPTRNDNSSEFYVLPDGSVRRPTGDYRDSFGDDHSLDYRYRFLDSHKYMERWRKAFKEIAGMESWLEESGIPLFLFFVAYWDEAVVHDLISGSEVRSPYVITPGEMATPDQQPKPWGHGTPETYRIYAQMIYQGVSENLGWPQFAGPTDGPQAGLFTRVPEGDWAAAGRRSVRRWCARVPFEYRATAEVDQRQCAGPMDCVSGLMGRATTILLQKKPQSTKLKVVVRKVPNLEGLYPLDVTVSIPSADGGREERIRVPVGGNQIYDLTLPIPGTIAGGSAVEVEIRASRAVLAPDVFSLRSVFVESIEQR